MSVFDGAYDQLMQLIASRFVLTNLFSLKTEVYFSHYQEKNRRQDKGEEGVEQEKGEQEEGKRKKGKRTGGVETMPLYNSK